MSGAGLGKLPAWLARWAHQAKIPPSFPQFSLPFSQGGAFSAVQVFGRLAWGYVAISISHLQPFAGMCLCGIF